VSTFDSGWEFVDDYKGDFHSQRHGAISSLHSLFAVAFGESVE
jgi:hypothetical protein